MVIFSGPGPGSGQKVVELEWWHFELVFPALNILCSNFTSVHPSGNLYVDFSFSIIQSLQYFELIP